MFALALTLALALFIALALALTKDLALLYAVVILDLGEFLESCFIFLENFHDSEDYLKMTDGQNWRSKQGLFGLGV